MRSFERSAHLSEEDRLLHKHISERKHPNTELQTVFCALIITGGSSRLQCWSLGWEMNNICWSFSSVEKSVEALDVFLRPVSDTKAWTGSKNLHVDSQSPLFKLRTIFSHFTHNHLYFCWFKMLVQVTFLFKIRQRLKTRHCESLRPRSNDFFVINSAKQFAFCLQITIRSEICFTSRTPPHHQLQLQFIGCDITLWANAHEAISRERRWREDGRGNECRTMRNRLKEKGWK